MSRINLSCLVGIHMDTLFSDEPELMPVDPELIASAHAAQVQEYMSSDFVRDPMGNVIKVLSFSGSTGMQNPEVQLYSGSKDGAGTVLEGEAHVLATAWSYLSWIINSYPDVYFVAPSIAQHTWRFMISRSQKHGLQVPSWAMDGLDMRLPYSKNQRLLCPLDAFRHGAKDMRNSTTRRLAIYLGMKDKVPSISSQDMALGLEKKPIPEDILAISMAWARLNREILYRLESCFQC